MNPFKYGCVVAGENYCRRPELQRQLSELVKSGQNVVVQGPRRMGKTSLVVETVKSLRGVTLLYVDLFSVRSVGEFCRKVVSATAKCGKRSFLERTAELVKGLRPVFSVDRQLSEPFMIHQGMNKKEAHEHALQMLYDVQIPNPEVVIKQYPHQLSGGMRQRVMIAMALACKPKILIADEPTTALDVTIQAQILKLMNDLKETTGTAIIFITHDLGVINEMADDVAVMYCGQVVEQAPADVIFRDCEQSHPYTEGLMMSIPRLETESDRLEPIPGVVPHPLALPKGCKFGPRCKYCTQKCIDEEPALKKVSEKQSVRCFYPNKEERNSAENKKITVHY